MATNKHAIIRYNALDRCFSNYGRKFFIEDLIQTCNDAIYEFSGIMDGVKRRQIFDDIIFMESDQGWSIPLERIKEGRRVYYRYSDKSFSIKNLGLNQYEAEQLKETLLVLSRFNGLPQFDWIEEMKIRLMDTFKLKGEVTNIVGFDQNPYLKGLNFFTDIFNSIHNQICLKIIYKGFKQLEPIEIELHPWYLKQYNNRWFLFGLNEKYKNISNLALDRIISIQASKVSYVKNNDFNFSEYFEDVIGVTVKSNAVVEKVIIKASAIIWPYIESKPIHGSQKIISKTESDYYLEFNLQVNYELISMIISYMDTIEVIEPLSLRTKIKEILEDTLLKYK
ncbi:MAG: WYL domain-containing protein [Bacteroidaceae bacterium]|nr:WYL domain-containing protein [Bacteroidaceae bacterium]MEA5099395.1 WYL domain-containing protein [Bacteroidales bacterium]